MENLQSDQVGPPPASVRRSGRARRVAATVGASAVLLGAGAAIGIALTGGASAAPASAGSPATRHDGLAAGKCTQVAQQLRKSGHPVAAVRLRALCQSPLLRLALVGGEYGQVTFQSKTGPKTLAFERGTVESVTGSQFTVVAPDGITWTWDITASTVFREARQVTTKAALGNGDKVVVGGPVVHGARNAKLVRIRAASAAGAAGATS
jgi:hypothetical protein